MEVLLGIGVLLIILFFSKVVSFNKKMMDIEIEGYKIYSEEDLASYRDHLMCQIIRKYPNIPDKEKVKIVIEAIRRAHIGRNKDYLNGLTYQYVFATYLERLREIKNMSSISASKFCMGTFRPAS